jgi:hypothetical protein
MYHLHTDWYADFLRIRSEVDDALADADVDEDEDEEPMGGFYSRN